MRVDCEVVDWWGSGPFGTTLVVLVLEREGSQNSCDGPGGCQPGGHGFLRESAAEISDAAMCHMLPVNQAEVCWGYKYLPPPPQEPSEAFIMAQQLLFHPSPLLFFFLLLSSAAVFEAFVLHFD